MCYHHELDINLEKLLRFEIVMYLSHITVEFWILISQKVID